jgi:hypothetical protein
LIQPGFILSGIVSLQALDFALLLSM